MSLVLMDTQPWGVVQVRNTVGEISVRPGISVQFKTLDGDGVPHWDHPGGTSIVGVLETNVAGELGRYIEEGRYLMVVNGEEKPIEAIAGDLREDWTAFELSIPATIDDAVTTAIADDGTVLAAAADAAIDAVDNELATRPLLEASEVDSVEYEFVFTDLVGGVTLGIRTDAQIDAKLSASSVEKIDATNNEKVSEGVAWAITDRQGRVSIGGGTDGHLLPEVIDIIAQDVITSPGMQDTITAGVLTAISSGLPLVANGDSITLAAGADEDGGNHLVDGWVPKLTSIYGIPTVNRGVTGDTDDEIAARQGGLVFQVTVTGGTIPASGGVTVVATLPTFSPTRGGAITGVLGLPDNTTIAGTFSGPSDRSSITFTRATAGSAIVVGASQLDAHCTAGDQYRKNIQTHWAGVNGLGAIDDTGWETLVSAGSYDDWDDAARHRYDPGADSEIGRITDDYAVEAQSIITNTAKMVGWMDAVNRRLIVLSPLDRGESEGTGTPKGAALLVIRNQLEMTYGVDYLDIHKYALTRGLVDGGFTPTAQDIADVQAKGVPASLRTGGVHPNIIFNTLIARQVAYHINRRDWV